VPSHVPAEAPPPYAAKVCAGASAISPSDGRAVGDLYRRLPWASLRRYLAIHAPVGRIAGGRVAELEALTGVETRRIHVDKGFRGHNHARKFRVWISGQVRRVTAPIRGKYGRGPPFERTKPAASKTPRCCIAAGRTTKRVSFPDFTPQNFVAPEIRRLMHLTTCRVDPARDAQYPAAWPARVEITLADGRTFSASAQHAKGDPRNPLSQDEVIAKHKSIVAGIVDDQTDDALLDFILDVETKPDFAELTRVLKGFVVQ
jgi:hypothetical protein